MNKRVSKSQLIPNVDRAFKILELLSASPDGLRFVDIYERLSLAKSSAFVLLDNLEMKGYVEKMSEGKYRATLKLFHLGSQVLKSMDIRAIALPFMTALRDDTGYPVHLASLDGLDVVYLEKVEGTSFIRFDTYIGKRSSIHLTAVGKAIAAFLSEPQTDEILAARGLGGGTEKAAANLADFKAMLQSVREKGYAIEDEEEVLGVRCMGAPIRNHIGDVTASISIIALSRDMPTSRFSELSSKIIHTARQISSALGGTG
ncbi:IclR family transcriptional regulator [Paenibacillus sp. LjRoot56]|uniref:IclR family transcriptional regulator n=1 Tax=Paenibacillus sp. LjRoot56 TaxID=3342333 RepID=UPI003ECE9282